MICAAAGEFGHGTKLVAYFDKVYRPKKLMRSPQTIHQYRMVFRRLNEALGREAVLSDLNDDVLSQFILDRLEAGLAQHTVDKERDKLLAIANFAARKRHIAEFPDVPRVAPASATPQSWRREHLEALFDSCRRAQGKIGSVLASDWWVAFNLVALFTGERTGAILALRWEWLAADTLRVPAEARKGRKKPMVYHLPCNVVAAIKKLRSENLSIQGLIFDNHWSRAHKSGAFYYRYTRLLKRAGLPTGRRFKPQCLRRTFASYLEAAGGDATKALAHTDRRTTVESYLDPSITDAGKESPADLVRKRLDF